MGYLDDKGLEHFWGKVKGYMDARPGGDVNSSHLVKAIVGTIVIWSGTADNIPTGWHLCDGTDGTPDLRDKFVLGAGEAHPVGETGGEEEVTLTVDQMPEHRHRYQSRLASASSLQSGGSSYSTVSSVAQSSSDTAGSSHPHPNMPPYCALCYIMKVTESGTSGGASEEVYSTEETRIGTWIDGKPLYRRVIANLTTPVNANSTSVRLGIVVPDVDIITNINGSCKWDNNSDWYIPLSATSCLVSYQKIENGADLYAVCFQSNAANQPLTVIIEYTKTTD